MLVSSFQSPTNFFMVWRDQVYQVFYVNLVTCSLFGKQARQAYLIGNKALAKELSVKGQLHNMHMKAAHGKAQDSIYRLRFVVFLLLFLGINYFHDLRD